MKLKELPPLGKMLKPFAAFTDGQSRHQALMHELRAAAAKLRRKKPHPFYSLREVATFFGVSRGTVAKVFQALEKEGILTRIRGSQTLLMGRESVSRDIVRGIVGVPIWTNAIASLSFTRTFAVELEEQLRRTGYIANFIFYSKKSDEAEPDFAERLLQHRVDTVILHTPAPHLLNNCLTLRERGIRLIVVQNVEDDRYLPAVYHLTKYEPAYRKLFKRWQRAGIQKVWIWKSQTSRHNLEEISRFTLLARSFDFTVEATNESPANVLKAVRSLRPSGSGAVAFLDTLQVEPICQYQPQVIEEISKVARVAFCVGDVRIPYLQHAGVKVDLVGYSPVKLAAQLARDIGQLAFIPDGSIREMDAEFSEQVVIEDPTFYLSNA